MKKAILAAVSITLCLAVLTGCKFSSHWNKPASSSVGYSAENPVPFGEYISIKAGKNEVQLKIAEVIPWEEQNLLFDVDYNITIVKLNIKVDKLDSYDFSLNSFVKFEILLNSGLIQKETSLKSSIEEKIGINSYSDIRFGGTGSADCYTAFEVNSSDCQCLVYNKGNLFFTKQRLYFALK